MNSQPDFWLDDSSPTHYWLSRRGGCQFGDQQCVGSLLVAETENRDIGQSLLQSPLIPPIRIEQ